MYKIVVQRLDYDDYPIGLPNEIGPFATEALANAFLNQSKFFDEVEIFPGYKAWKWRGRNAHSVRVVPLASGLTDPKNYL